MADMQRPALCDVIRQRRQVNIEPEMGRLRDTRRAKRLPDSTCSGVVLAIPVAYDPADAPYPTFTELFSWLRRNLAIDRDWTILELGTGSQGFAWFYRKEFSRVIGVDIIDYSPFHQG